MLASIIIKSNGFSLTKKVIPPRRYTGMLRYCAWMDVKLRSSCNIEGRKVVNPYIMMSWKNWIKALGMISISLIWQHNRNIRHIDLRVLESPKYFTPFKGFASQILSPLCLSNLHCSPFSICPERRSRWVVNKSEKYPKTS